MRKKNTKQAFNHVILYLSFCFICLTFFSSVGESNTDSCIQCHSDKNFIVTNKKLYDYYQEWNSSIHKQEDVGCVDCHSGNPDKKTIRGAHGGKSGITKMRKAVNFANIPKTCGQCHEDIYNGYIKSNHYKHLNKQAQVEQGPNCVTCHGSLNAVVLNVNTVKKTCISCHNEISGNNPNIPDKAEHLLNKFLSLNRFYRYVRIRGDGVEVHNFLKDMDNKIEELSVNWHTFDLDKFERDSRVVLDALKKMRQQVKKDLKKTN